METVTIGPQNRVGGQKSQFDVVAIETNKVIATMCLQPIGRLSEGIDGSDEYYLVTVSDVVGDEEPDANTIEQWMLPVFYRESTAPGGYFCNTVRVIPEECNTSRFILRVSHRYDV